MKTKTIGFIILSFLVASCGASTPRFTNANSSGDRKTNASEKNVVRVDENLEEYANVKPIDSFTGVASYYADQYNGNRTSNGEIYNMNSMTAAHRDFPFDSIVRVINIENNKSVILRVNDRGPLKKGRIIDVSLEAARQLEMIGKGTANVRIEVLKYGKN
jgi:rare lipoprotein A (peptidoglycan hydrolase)